MIGTCTGAVPTNTGLRIYVKFEELAPSAMKDGGFSLELPLYNFLPEGQFPVVPAVAGLYEITLSNGAVLQASYDPVTAVWSGSSNIPIGNLHEVRLPDWKYPAIVVGVKLLAAHQAAMKTVVVSESVVTTELVGEEEKE